MAELLVSKSDDQAGHADQAPEAAQQNLALLSDAQVQKRDVGRACCGLEGGDYGNRREVEESYDTAGDEPPPRLAVDPGAGQQRQGDCAEGLRGCEEVRGAGDERGRRRFEDQRVAEGKRHEGRAGIARLLRVRAG